jgi:two-component system, OmpR family, sensor histidine kinase VicK
MTVEPAKQAVIEAKERGVKPRQITEITKDNLPYCKEFMKYADLRHMGNVQGNMVVTDNDEYVATASINPSSVAQAIYSNAKTIIEQQRLFFENLWNKSIPAEQRIREIEEGIESINLEILSSNQESGTRGLKLVQDAKNEVLVLFPSPHVLDAALGLGIADMYNQAAKRGVTIKILVQASKDSQSMLAAAKKKLLPLIHIRTIQDRMQNIRMSILVADKKEVIVWNMLEVHTNDLYQMAGNAIYSSNSSVVSSYHAIFTSLWNQVEMYERIIAHEELQKDFINIAAHELRTPIQPLLGTADLLESQLDGKGEAKITKDEIDMIVRNARRLERLSSDILTVSRIETKSLQLFKEAINLGEKIRDVVADAKAFAKDNKALKIIYEPPAEPIMVKADKSKLFEVLSNLIRNAIKFTEQGAITVTLEKDGNQVIVNIKDSGTGIDAEIMPRLFEKFATKSDKGTGLGLFISKSIIDAHGGRIWAINNPGGRGATFSFSLPIS